MAGCLLLLVVALTTAVGCSSDATTTTAATDSVQTSTTDGSSPPTTGSLMTEWDKLLRNNAKIQHQFAIYLSEIDAANDDPLLGLYYGIQARTNALTCRKALAEEALETADAAMLEVYYALNRGRSLAQGSVADMLSDAYAVVETLGAPSNDPQNAAAILERFLETSEPIVDQVTATISSAATTTPPSAGP